jgi:hypothetical protein
MNHIEKCNHSRELISRLINRLDNDPSQFTNLLGLRFKVFEGNIRLLAKSLNGCQLEKSMNTVVNDTKRKVNLGSRYKDLLYKCTKLRNEILHGDDHDIKVEYRILKALNIFLEEIEEHYLKRHQEEDNYAFKSAVLSLDPKECHELIDKLDDLMQNS